MGGATAKLLDGPGRYSLQGFVSHMGASTAAGHYVAHVRKEGRWVIYNDEKVQSETLKPYPVKLCSLACQLGDW